VTLARWAARKTSHMLGTLNVVRNCPSPSKSTKAEKESSKTTEIYTHVSTKNFQNITTPADLLFSDMGKVKE